MKGRRLFDIAGVSADINGVSVAFSEFLLVEIPLFPVVKGLSAVEMELSVVEIGLSGCRPQFRQCHSLPPGIQLFCEARATALEC